MFQHQGMNRSKSDYEIKFKGRQLPNSGMYEYTYHFSKKLLDQQGWEPGQKLTYGYDDETGQFGFKEFEQGADLQGWTLQNINAESSNCRFSRKCREDKGYPISENKYGVELTVSPEKVAVLGSEWVMASLPDNVFNGVADEAPQSIPSTEERSEYGQ